MERRKLSQFEIEENLGQLPGWQLKEGKLFKTYRFASFAQAIGWMVSVAIYADKLDHHPDWSNVYNRVDVHLVTHDMGALTTWDVSLAKNMEELAAG